MPDLLPITFKPIYQERVWGGRMLETRFQRILPDPDTPYGESWEITDREYEQSFVSSGIYNGRSLHDLWTNLRSEIFGENLFQYRFPLLIKILDCRQDLSVQVHPPEKQAILLGGEPKTETWYIADMEPESKLYVGLKEKVTKESFRQALGDGTVADQIHSISPEVGDSIFIPSGRLHAIGGGFLIYEIQQNSDTTYRVFDWNRRGLDGKPRQLHVEESLRCIDFTDHEPAMDVPTGPNGQTITDCEHFHIEKLDLVAGTSIGNPQHDRFSIITVVSGTLSDTAGNHYKAGDFFLLPRAAAPLSVYEEALILQTTIPDQKA